jgi:hypothetical protein
VFQVVFVSHSSRPKFCMHLAPFHPCYICRPSHFHWSLWVVRNMVVFYGEELVAPRPTLNLEDHPLSAVRNCLFNIFTPTLHICRPFLHPQPEDAPCRGDRDPLIKVRVSTQVKYLFKTRLIQPSSITTFLSLPLVTALPKISSFFGYFCMLIKASFFIQEV